MAPRRTVVRRVVLVAVAVGVALAPALTGLRGNDSFAQSVPVSIPQGAEVVTFPDDGSPEPTGSPTRKHQDDTVAAVRDDSPDAADDASKGSRPSPRATTESSGKRNGRPTPAPSRSSAAPRPSATADDHSGKPRKPRRSPSPSPTTAPTPSPEPTPTESVAPSPEPTPTPSAVETDSGKGRHGGGNDGSGHG